MGQGPAIRMESSVPGVIFKTGSIGGLVDSLVVLGSIENSSCEMVIDTGSNITLVRPDVLRRLSSKVDAVKLEHVECFLKTATGETAPVRSRGKLRIKM